MSNQSTDRSLPKAPFENDTKCPATQQSKKVGNTAYRMRYRIRYHEQYVRILVSKAMAVNVEGIAPRFGSSVEQVDSHLMPPNVRSGPVPQGA